eukprot:141153_1
MEGELGMDVTEKHLKGEVEAVDSNKNGVIDYNEFLTVMARKKEEDLKEEEKALTKAFDVFDEDGNGFIDESELKYAMNGLLHKNKSDQEIKAMFNEADMDKDGEIDFPEFAKMAQEYSANPASSGSPNDFRLAGIDTNSSFYTKGFEVGIVGLLLIAVICIMVKIYNHYKRRKSKIYHALAVINATEDIEIG